MELIRVLNIKVLNNSTTFLDKFQFEITMEIVQPIKEECHWKIIYIGAAQDDKFDQILDTFCLGPFPEKLQFKFTISTNPPDHTLIPSKNDVLGVTALILSCSYWEREFFRCGYYVYNYYTDQDLIDIDTPETPVQIQYVQRNILSEQPRITRYQIWEEEIENRKCQQIDNSYQFLYKNLANINYNLQKQMQQQPSVSNSILDKIQNNNSLNNNQPNLIFEEECKEQDMIYDYEKYFIKSDSQFNVENTTNKFELSCYPSSFTKFHFSPQKFD